MEDAELTAKYGRIRAQKTARPYVADKRGEWPYVIQTSAMAAVSAPHRIDVACDDKAVSVDCEHDVHRRRCPAGARSIQRLGANRQTYPRSAVTERYTDTTCDSSSSPGFLGSRSLVHSCCRYMCVHECADMYAMHVGMCVDLCVDTISGNHCLQTCL